METSNLVNNSNVWEVLTNLGYQLQNCGHYYTSSAVYRSGDSNKSLVIYPNDNLCIDYARNGEKFSIKKLIALTLGVETRGEVENWLLSNNIVLKFNPPKPKLNFPKIYPQEILKDLVPIYKYWNDRKISSETLRLFEGGVTGNKGKMKYRFVFPIFNHKKEIIGFTGRDLLKNGDKFKRPKWKILGNKTTFKYPLFLNHQIIKEKKEVILIEGISDCLSLWEVGIKNCICLFGVRISPGIINFLIKYDINKIIISTNNDELNNGCAGNDAAQLIKLQLLHFFDDHQVAISLPTTHKDWNEVLINEGPDEISNWYNNLES